MTFVFGNSMNLQGITTTISNTILQLQEEIVITQPGSRTVFDTKEEAFKQRCRSHIASTENMALSISGDQEHFAGSNMTNFSSICNTNCKIQILKVFNK